MPVKQSRLKVRAGVQVTRRADIYGRTSGDEQEAAGTIETQLLKARQYAAIQELTVAREWRDDGWSGFSYRMEERPDGAKLVERIKNREIDAVLVFALDRLARRLLYCAEFIELCKKHDVAIISVSQGINTLDPIGEMIAQMLMAFAQWERGAILSRTVAGRDRVLGEPGCRWLNGPVPPGYTLEYRPVPGRRAEAPFLVVDEAARELWAQVFGNVAAGGSAVGEVRRLTALGIPAGARYAHQSRPGRWHLSRLTKLLHNPVYRGTHEAFKSDGSVVERPCPAIVTPEVWEAVQRQLTANKRKGHAARVYTLSGLAVCGHCGAAYVGATNRGYKLYRCNRAASRRARCEGRQVSAGFLEGAVRSWLDRWLDDPDEAYRDAEKQVREQEDRLAQATDERPALRARLRELEAERAQVREMTRRRMYEMDEGERIVADLTGQIALLDGQVRAQDAVRGLAGEMLGGMRRGLGTLHTRAAAKDELRQADDAEVAGLLREVTARVEVTTHATGPAEVKWYPLVGHPVVLDTVETTIRPRGGFYVAL